VLMRLLSENSVLQSRKMKVVLELLLVMTSLRDGHYKNTDVDDDDDVDDNDDDDDVDDNYVGDDVDEIDDAVHNYDNDDVDEIDDDTYEKGRVKLYVSVLRHANGLQDALLAIADGLKQFHFSKRTKVATVPHACRRLSLLIFRTCVGRIIRSQNQRDAQNVILPRLAEWFGVLREIYAEPLGHDLDAMQNTVSAIRTLNVFCISSAQSFRVWHSCLVVAVAAALHNIVIVLRLLQPSFVNMIVNDLEGEIEEDEDGGCQSLITAVSEFVFNVVGRRDLQLVWTTELYEADDNNVCTGDDTAGTKTVSSPTAKEPSPKTSSPVIGRTGEQHVFVTGDTHTGDTHTGDQHHTGDQLSESSNDLFADLIDVLLNFMHITEAQCQLWKELPSEFLWEDNSLGSSEYSLRRAGENLIARLIKVYPQTTIDAVLHSAARFAGVDDTVCTGSDTDDNRHDTSPVVDDGAEAEQWKRLETALWVTGLVAKHKEFTNFFSSRELEQIALLLGQVMGQRTTPQFLRARSFCAAANSRYYLKKCFSEDIDNILFLSAIAMQPQEPFSVRVSACRSFEKFLPLSSNSEFKHNVILQNGVLDSLTNLLTRCDESFVHCALSVLSSVVVSTPEVIELDVIQVVLDVWSEARGNPLTHGFFLKFIHTACSADTTVRLAVESHIVPAVSSSIQTASSLCFPGGGDDDQSPTGGFPTRFVGAVEPHAIGATFDVFITLLRLTCTPITNQFWNCFDDIVKIGLTLDELGIQQSVCEVIALFVSREPRTVRQSGRIPLILSYAGRLLDPIVDPHNALMAGPLLLLILRFYGRDLLNGDIVTRLFHAMILRVSNVMLLGLRWSLLTVFCRLICEECGQMVKVLKSFEVALTNVVTGFDAFVTLLLRTVERPAGIPQSRYMVNVMSTALVALMSDHLEEVSAVPTSSQKPVQWQWNNFFNFCCHDVEGASSFGADVRPRHQS